jgi:hypothetical protein
MAGPRGDQFPQDSAEKDLSSHQVGAPYGQYCFENTVALQAEAAVHDTTGPEQRTASLVRIRIRWVAEALVQVLGPMCVVIPLPAPLRLLQETAP